MSSVKLYDGDKRRVRLELRKNMIQNGFLLEGVGNKGHFPYHRFRKLYRENRESRDVAVVLFVKVRNPIL